MTPEEMMSAQTATMLSEAIERAGVPASRSGQLVKLWSPAFKTEVDEAGRFRLVTLGGSPAEPLIKSQLESDEYSHFRGTEQREIINQQAEDARIRQTQIDMLAGRTFGVGVSKPDIPFGMIRPQTATATNPTTTPGVDKPITPFGMP